MLGGATREGSGAQMDCYRPASKEENERDKIMEGSAERAITESSG
jgi:hypothetical protein